ncbi:hypothetical protein K1W69_17350 [Hoeflea sp. WL0058]|uniref:Chromosomal replication initiator DnaA C-terminal domain-containing protein n=1 Tax=Flavimaribacter sediminis TaxID=2865987 RepID=A0AAE2ZMK6_9HYPH|nr:helix-turn-helix domain-containing protein [Flavimaribacter sediminis]MBW8638966.1 hypothetical protein [Flavimaribacter sediminis]
MMRIANIIHTVAIATGADMLDIVSDRRGPAFARPRHIAMFLTKECTPCTYREIGDAFNKLDHSTVRYAVEKIASEIKTDAGLRELITALKASIEYRTALADLDKVDVLGVARQIVLRPRHGSMAASTNELAALAVFALDLWEVASCAEAMAQSIRTIELPDPDPGADNTELPRLRLLADAILDEMNHIAGAPSEPVQLQGEEA